MDREVRGQSDPEGVVPEKAGTNAMEGTCPGEQGSSVMVTQNSSRSTDHFVCRATRECQEENPDGIDSIRNHVRHTMGKRIGLAGPGAGDDQKRRTKALLGSELNGGPLGIIQGLVAGDGR
jgi:hypothetical protein